MPEMQKIRNAKHPKMVETKVERHAKAQNVK
jgi:hypothetical protein